MSFAISSGIAALIIGFTITLRHVIALVMSAKKIQKAMGDL
jgi:hypothetical protein